MLANYLTVALRSLRRQRLTAAINIGGLAVGLACAILITLFVRDETSFDKWVPGAGDLYRVQEGFRLPGRAPLRFATSDFPLPVLLKDNLPEVTGYARLRPMQKTITVGGQAYAQDIDEVDPDFLQVIRFPLAQGDPASALARPDAIVLSQTLARKLFGDADPMGRTLTVNQSACGPFDMFCPNSGVALRVTGVLRDLPYDTQLRAEAIMPHTSPADAITEKGKHIYYAANTFGYVRLAHGADPAAVAGKIPALLDRNVDVLQDLGMSLKASDTIKIELVPFRDVHLKSGGAMGELVPPGSPATLYGLGAIGALILLVAGVNFTNLATARALLRAREIALRKCAGARPGQVVVQFLGEAVLTALLALVLALSLVEVLLPAFDQFLNRPIGLDYVRDWPVLALILAMAVALGLLSGAYPALVLSRVRPAPVLRANSRGHTGSPLLRSALVVAQFSVAIGLAIVTLATFSQIDFMRHQALGFRRDNILVINTGRRMTTAARDAFIGRLRSHAGVADVAISSDTPFSGQVLAAQMRLPGHGEYLTMDRQLVSPDFFRLYGMRLVSGRVFSVAYGADRLKNDSPLSDNNGCSIVINESAARRFGFTAAGAVGQMVLFGPSQVRIVGVVADTHVDSAREPPRAMVYLDDPVIPPLISVRIAAGHVPEVTAFVARAWRDLSPDVALDSHFLDDSFAKLYAADETQGQMFAGFVGVAIALACLGLFGLAAFTAARRTREIGVRKVFGARIGDLTLLLLWRFSIPVLVANLIAWPVAWFYLSHWLQGFSYRIALSPSDFLAAGLGALAIAWATVFTHAWRVARANPIHALRYE